MGNLLTRELKRDWIHLSEHSDFKNALKATSDLLETYAKAERLRVERGVEEPQATMDLPNDQHGRRKRRHTSHSKARGEIPHDGDTHLPTRINTWH